MLGFSALQRAENSSIRPEPDSDPRRAGFSALQRAENSSIFLFLPLTTPRKRFSALQRAENSSIRLSEYCRDQIRQVSVLFSEPKIPQYLMRAERLSGVGLVSVLFSEPKIPQLCTISTHPEGFVSSFSALQRAENSSIRSPTREEYGVVGFSALQRAENSSIMEYAAG